MEKDEKPTRAFLKFDLAAIYKPTDGTHGQYYAPYYDHVSEAQTIGEISDGYHTFNELYAHRIELFIALCRQLARHRNFIGQHSAEIIGRVEYEYVWRSQQHSDGSAIDGWFVMGIRSKKGKQMTYHLPIDRWEDCDFAETLERAPEFDGHTSADVLERLKKL